MVSVVMEIKDIEKSITAQRYVKQVVMDINMLIGQEYVES